MSHAPAKPVPALIVLALLLVSTVAVVQGRPVATQFKVPAAVVAGGGGSGCNSPCLFRTSFTVAENWLADIMQSGAGCGAGFGGHQTEITDNGGWSATGGSGTSGCDEVNTAANYASGRGGRALHHMRGGGADNNTGGGMSVTLASSATEIWISYRFRFAAGYGGTPVYTKDLYWETGIGFLVHGLQGSASWGFNTNGSNNYPGSLSWTSTYGGSTADGSWHCFDAYHKISTNTATIWIDGVQRLTTSSVSYTNFPNFSFFKFGENQTRVSTVDGIPPSSTDYDDLQIDNDLTAGQRIGCPGSGG